MKSRHITELRELRVNKILSRKAALKRQAKAQRALNQSSQNPRTLGRAVDRAVAEKDIMDLRQNLSRITKAIPQEELKLAVLENDVIELRGNLGQITASKLK